MKLFLLFFIANMVAMSSIVIQSTHAIDSPFGYRDGTNGTIRVVHGKKELVIKAGTTIVYDREYDSEDITSVVIPDSVISIGDYAFADNDLTEVIIPDSVTEIGDRAFADNDLEAVKIGSAVVTIGSSAFADNDLTEVIIPDSVTDVGTWAFSDNDLERVMLTKKLHNAIKQKSFLSSYFGNEAKYELFDKTPIYVAKSRGRVVVSTDAQTQKQRTLTIKNGVTSINKNEFANQGITALVIPPSVVSIGASAFANNQITAVVIPPSVISVGLSAFSGNPLTTVTLSKALYDAIPIDKLDDIFGESVTTYWKK